MHGGIRAGKRAIYHSIRTIVDVVTGGEREKKEREKEKEKRRRRGWGERERERICGAPGQSDVYTYLVRVPKS